MADSSRSPPCDSTAPVKDRSARPVPAYHDTPVMCAPQSAMAMEPSVPASTPPMNPDHVFFGLMRGQSLGPPKVRPEKNAPMSVIQTTPNSQRMATTPFAGSERSA